MSESIFASVRIRCHYGALYVLGSTSRLGNFAPSLWANFITTCAAWGGRNFMNYNEEAPLFGVFSSNPADLAEPCNNMVLAQMPWQRNRTAEAGIIMSFSAGSTHRLRPRVDLLLFQPWRAT